MRPPTRGWGEPAANQPEPDVGEADDDRVLERRPRHDRVAVQTALVVAAGRLGLLERITEAELDELGAERVAGAQLRGDGVGPVHVLRSRHAGVDLGQQRDVGVAGRQSRRDLARTPPALDVPGRHAHPARQLRRLPGLAPVDLVQAGKPGQQPAMKVLVAEPGRPTSPLRGGRCVHPPSLSSVPADVRPTTPRRRFVTPEP